jgi:ubiquinone/menaquinone biosynthesis C-methylase UbiE
MMLRLLDAAFAHPRGLPGWLGGTIMARSTGLRNEWTISLLDIQPSDRILEVGFGPGALIEALAAKVPQGSIAGVDTSPLMLKQASRRNARTISEGRIRLRLGSAQALPFEDTSFDKAVSANSVPMWSDRLAGVKEMQRVLKPGGLVSIVLQPVWARTDDEVKKIGAELVELLSTAGFQQVRLEFKSMKPIASVCALGIK